MPLSKLTFFSLVACIAIVSCGDESKVNAEQQKQLPRRREEIILSYAPVVKKVAPAVVNVYAFQHAKAELPASPFMQDPFFKQFFDRFHHDKNSDHRSLGSGVLASKEGIILTNYHVIENADVIQVALADKREFVAKLITADKRTDLALLKIEDGGDFPYLTISPQEDLEVGDVVLAIGNPFGVGQTVTTGIVSALARSQEGINDFRTFIQTDAAINPGNSGGALVTTDGRLVGINTAIYSKSGGSMGISFAIPTSLAIPVMESVNNGGRIVRPWIGLEAVPLTPKAAHALGLSRPYGALVKNVYQGGPADKAGIKVGDFIASIDGHKIEDDASLDYRVAISPVGGKAEVIVFRKGQEKKLPIVFVEPMNAKDSSPTQIEGPNPLQGVKIRTLSPALALDMGLNPMKQGVVIAEVLKTGPAAQLGVQAGDILESINKKSVRTKEEAVNILRTKGHAWVIILRRGDKRLTVQVSE